jgi:hypothetical protein
LISISLFPEKDEVDDMRIQQEIGKRKRFFDPHHRDDEGNGEVRDTEIMIVIVTQELNRSQPIKEIFQIFRFSNEVNGPNTSRPAR